MIEQSEPYAETSEDEALIEDEESDLEEDEDSIPDMEAILDNAADGGDQGSQDTVPAAHPSDLGLQEFDDTRCLVRLSAKSKGRELLCGYPLTDCNRRRHDILRKDRSKRGLPGYYMATLNSSQTVLDAVEPTYVSYAARAEEHSRNRDMMATVARDLRTSEQKEQTEERIAGRMPVVVGFTNDIDTERERQDSTTPRRDRMNAWREGLGSSPDLGNPRTTAIRTAENNNPTGSRTLDTVPTPIPTAPTPTPPAPRTTPNAPNQNGASSNTDPQVLRLLDKMIDRFEELEVAIQMNQQVFQEQLSLTRAARSDNTKRSPIDNRDQPTRPTSKKAPSRWYAVSIGRSTGVFTSWPLVCDSVKGYPGATYKRFHSETQAKKWLQHQWNQDPRDQPLVPDEAWEELSFDGTQVGGPPDIQSPDSELPRTIGAPYGGLLHQPMTQGKDGSAGDPTKLFGVSIEVESEVLKLLCPKGVTDTVKREIMDTAVDVVSLPGKYNQAGSTSDSALVIDQVAEAIGDLAANQARRSGRRPPRDSQWRTAPRNALTHLKSFEELSDAADEISSQTEVVLRNMTMSIKDILYLAGWSTEDSELYCTAGLLPRIVRDTITKFHQLHIFLQRMALNHPGRWSEFTAFYLDYHTKNLGRIRLHAPSYAQMVIQVYIYLRDAEKKQFGHQSVSDKIMSALEARLTTTSAKKTTPSERPYKCAHCHGNFHEGGKKACPMADLKTKVAQKIATEYAAMSPPNPEELERMIATAKAAT